MGVFVKLLRRRVHNVVYLLILRLVNGVNDKSPRIIKPSETSSGVSAWSPVCGSF